MTPLQGVLWLFLQLRQFSVVPGRPMWRRQGLMHEAELDGELSGEVGVESVGEQHLHAVVTCAR